MKNYLGFIFILLFVSCQKESINYAKLTGKVLAEDIEKLSIQGRTSFKTDKSIKEIVYNLLIL